MNPGKSNFDIGDKVFVVDWGQKYSQIASSRGVFWKDDERVLQYSSTDFFEKVIRQELNQNGKPWKKPWDAPIIRREYPWKNFKWKIIDLLPHPKYGEYWYENEEQRKLWGSEKGTTRYVYLLQSSNHGEYGFAESSPCFCEIGENGLSILTPEQFTDTKFNALKEHHRGKWTSDTAKKLEKEAPELVEKVYDKNDNVLFGSKFVKGKVSYNYVPGEFMNTGRPFIINTSILYDGKGNDDPEMKIVTWEELKQMFPDNTFGR